MIAKHYTSKYYTLKYKIIELYDLSRARQVTINRTPAHIERAILTIRRRLAARTTPQTRYALLGAPAIAQELKQLGLSPVPTLRTIERVLERAHVTSPRLRLAQRIPKTQYPMPKANDTNQVHQIDLVGPRYLNQDKTKYYFYVCLLHSGVCCGTGLSCDSQTTHPIDVCRSVGDTSHLCCTIIPNEHYSSKQEIHLESHPATAPAADRPKSVGVSRGPVLPLACLFWLCACASSNGAIFHVICHI